MPEDPRLVQDAERLVGDAVESIVRDVVVALDAERGDAVRLVDAGRLSDDGVWVAAGRLDVEVVAPIEHGV